VRAASGQSAGVHDETSEMTTAAQLRPVRWKAMVWIGGTAAR
jgi:hypothetical protein